MPQHSSNSGFTLVELVIVIMIVGILTAIALPGFFSAMRRSTFQNKIGEVVQLIELARTQALASEMGADNKIPPGGYGVHFDKLNSKAILFIDNWNVSVGQSVRVDYANVTNRVIPDQIFTQTGDTILKTITLNNPEYLNLSVLSGTRSDGTAFADGANNAVTIIFTPPYADTILHATSNGSTFTDLQDVALQIKLVTENITRKIKLNRITTTPQVVN